MRDFYQEARKLHKKQKVEEARKLYEQGIEAGDEKCWYGYAALSYQNGSPEEQTNALKIINSHYENIKSLAQNGDVDAKIIIAFCIWNQHVTDSSVSVLDCFKEASDLGSGEGAFWCGYIYQNGEGEIRPNYHLALQYYFDSFQMGYNDGRCYYDELLSWMFQKAENGDCGFLNNLGVYYFQGKFLDQDYKKAFEMFEKSAKLGEKTGQYNLGLMYQFGHGVEQDVNEAYRHYLAAANQGHTSAKYYLGCMYRYGRGVEQDESTAAKWIKQAADDGVVEAMLDIAMMYKYGNGIEKDAKQAVKYFSDGAEKRYSPALTGLGTMYQFGQGVEMDYKKARELYNEAATLGDGAAYNNLAVLYFEGLGVEKNYAYAAECLKKSADLGYTLANLNLGIFYQNGTGVPVDMEKSAEYFKEAAKEDSSIGWFALAKYYLADDVIAKEHAEEIMDLLERSAAENLASAYVYLGHIFDRGDIVPKDPQQACKYWEKASECVHKSSEAMYRLGYAYYDAYGVDRNLEKSKYYFEQAHANGYACSYAIDMVKYELADREINKKSSEELGENTMRIYAEEIIAQKIFGAKIYDRITKDLKKDFGKTWDKLQKTSQDFLATSIYIYISMFSLGANIYGNMDFSPVIIQICKALENELGKYLYAGYIKYLIDNNISPNSFPPNRSFVKRTGKNSFEYKNSDNWKEFSLGSLDKVVGLHKMVAVESSSVVVDFQMNEYIKHIIKENELGRADRDRVVNDYLVYFTQEVKSIADSVRNPAAHTDKMNCTKAEVCGNYIIKVKKILKHFLEKLK